MEVTNYPSLEETLYLHRMLIEKFGGSHGIRDLGLLESSLARPRSGYYETLSQQAAALLHSLVNNHCFIDGNKRVAFALMAIFLRINGYDFKIKATVAEKFILKNIIEKHADVSAISAWLEKYMIASNSPL